jgi:hypothetical protein
MTQPNPRRIRPSDPTARRGTTARCITVPGSRVPGLSTAYALQREAHVTFYKAGARVGGDADRRGERPIGARHAHWLPQSFPRRSTGRA